MSQTVGELLTATLGDLGVTQVFGIVGDALNPFTDAIRRDERVKWLGVRHEEGAALAAAGQTKLTGRLGVCARTTGPGGTHLLAGLYEARHDHAPVQGATFRNPDFAMYAQACGATGLRATQPNRLRDTLALATPGPVIVDVVGNPAEIPSMPHIHADQVWKFGIGKMREAFAKS